MSPKEKAKELLNTFLDTDIDNRLFIARCFAKRNALLCVYIIKESILTQYKNDAICHPDIPFIKYWEQVEEEINKYSL